MARRIEKPVALVLGAAVWADGQASPTLHRRASQAATLYKDGQIGHIVGCGGIGQHAPSEAEVIRDICITQGVPAADISLEDTSTTTLENIDNARPILTQLGAKSVVIVTDHYHSLRAKMIARHFGMSSSVSCPKNQGTKRLRVMKSYAREIPALMLYMVRLKRG